MPTDLRAEVCEVSVFRNAGFMVTFNLRREARFTLQSNREPVPGSLPMRSVPADQIKSSAMELAARIGSAVGVAAKADRIALRRSLRMASRRGCAAAEAAMVWLVRNGREAPAESAKRVGAEWAMAVLARDVIAPMLETRNWKRRRRIIARMWGYDLAEEAPGWIWLRIDAWHDQGNGFTPWCQVVLENYYNRLCEQFHAQKPEHRVTRTEYTQVRLGLFTPAAPQARKAAEPDKLLAPTERSKTRYALALAAASNGSMQPEDLATMDGWSPADAVVLAGLSGLWRRIPEEYWQRWTRGFPDDFLEKFRETRKTAQREVLAAALGMKRAAIDQKWHRGQALLKSLRTIRSAIADAEAILDERAQRSRRRAV